MDHELAMGLTFLRTACAADEELDPEFWVNSLVDEFASAPLGNWSGFEQKGYEGNKQQKQWLVLMYAIMLEFGAGDPLKTVGLNPTSGQSVIEQAMLMAGPTLVDLLKEFVDKTYGDPTASDSKLRGFRMTQDEADGRAPDRDYKAVVNDPTGWSVCCETDSPDGTQEDFVSFEFLGLDPNSDHGGPVTGIPAGSRCKGTASAKECAQQAQNQPWFQVACQVEGTSCGSMSERVFVSPEYQELLTQIENTFDLNSDAGTKLSQDTSTRPQPATGTTNYQFTYDEFRRAIEELLANVKDASHFWLAPSWWISMTDEQFLTSAWELQDLVAAFPDLDQTTKGGGVIFKIPSTGYTSKPPISELEEERWGDFNHEGASQGDANSYFVPARGLGNNTYFYMNGTACDPDLTYCDIVLHDQPYLDWETAYLDAVKPDKFADYTRQVKGSPVRLVRFGGVYSLGFDLPGDGEAFTPVWGCGNNNGDVQRAQINCYRPSEDVSDILAGILNRESAEQSSPSGDFYDFEYIRFLEPLINVYSHGKFGLHQEKGDHAKTVREMVAGRPACAYGMDAYSPDLEKREPFKNGSQFF